MFWKNKLVLIEKRLIVRSLLKKNKEVSHSNKRKYKPYLNTDILKYNEPMKYMDLVSPYYTFSIITRELKVIPQKGDKIGDIINDLGTVIEREIYFRNPNYPPLSSEVIKVRESNGNQYDIKLTLNPEIFHIYGENLNDIDIQEVWYLREKYYSMFKMGFDNNNKKSDHEFWEDWREQFSIHGLYDD